MDVRRRELLVALAGTPAAMLAGCSVPLYVNDVACDVRQDGFSLRKLGQAGLSTPGFYAEGSLSPDGRYAVVGTRKGNGTYLVDLEQLASPTVVHHLPTNDASKANQLDVKFDSRGGLYYRTKEVAGDEHSDGGVEAVDFGFRNGSPSEPAVVGHLEAPSAHNVFPHPNRPLLYVALTRPSDDRGLQVWDVSDPADPVVSAKAWPRGGLHDIVVDSSRDLVHCASNQGYAVLDNSEPTSPRERGWFDYDAHPDYTEIGTPGFEGGHYALPDPDRDLAVVGDEVTEGVPGGKHVFDIGWGDGSPEDPRPVGFVHSPNARVREDDDDTLWTTHNHDVVPHCDGTLLVSGDYSEGVVLYDLTDPTQPTPLSTYRTDDGADQDADRRAPWAWSAVYHRGRGFVLASDQASGVYTFELRNG